MGGFTPFLLMIVCFSDSIRMVNKLVDRHKTYEL
jgi:hypothetical protein